MATDKEIKLARLRACAKSIRAEHEAHAQWMLHTWPDLAPAVIALQAEAEAVLEEIIQEFENG
ncbi:MULTISPECIES: hypothetical protein [Pseudofrankia]|uniref:hypothetical protein n=1 Tax=Pseudofrankia TaxID=2994363 RepID=UPI000234C84A|nr:MULTISPECIES: hypothetical protein [Pseudofrankia]